jgi:hypothetical protein
MDSTNTTKDSKTDESLETREKSGSIWNFRENKIELNFENLIVFIRMFLLLCIFYMFVWIFRDKNADIRSIGQLFSLWNSVLCSAVSIYYIFTGSVYATLIIGASLCSYLIADLYYGYFHYHRIMCSPNGYIHHFIYLFTVLYSIFYGFINMMPIYSLCEIATFFVNIKLIYRLDTFFMQLMILLSFILFRIVYWVFIPYKNINFLKEYKFIGILNITTLLLHTQWTSIHGYKTWKKYISK